MKFTKFEFKNFKGIEHIELNLMKAPESNVFTLVGLNESGKTTLLEAINYFTHKIESLQPLELDRYKITDIHELIPISKRANFNGTI
ncbi:MAG: AAA family ATPase, partial [Bacteroidetes bacterium]|nr:AAA family ATPase [Bacteroidota bacterium]